MARAKGVDPKTYAQNVLKSAGYIASETIKGVNPTLTSYITDSASYAKDMYSDLKDIRGLIRRKIDNVSGAGTSDELKEVKSNIIDDLRTGKFYNKERTESKQMEWMKAEGLSFDFDFDDFDKDLEADELGSSESSSATDTTIKSAAAGIAMSNEQISNISTARIIGGARANTRATISANQKLFAHVNNNIAVVNGSILALHQDLAKPLNVHIINSMNFYQTSLQEQAKQTEYLKHIDEMLSSRFAPASGASSKKGGSADKTDWEKVFGGGLPDLEALGKVVKTRAMEKSGASMIGSFIDPEMMKMIFGSGMLSSPISLATTMILTSKIQNGPTGKALDRFVNTLQSGFVSTAARISAYNKEAKRTGKSGPLAFLANLLDLSPDYKNKIDFGNYNKGNAVWSGKDSKALQTVIPTQLAKILAVLQGKNEAEIFDYDSGTWKSAAKAKVDFDRKRYENASRGTGNFKNQVLQNFIENDIATYREKGDNTTAKLSMNSRAVRDLGKEFDTLIGLLSMSGASAGSFRTKADLQSYVNKKGWIKDGLITQKGFNRIANSIYYKRVNGKDQFRTEAHGNMTAAIYGGQIADMRFQREIAPNSTSAAIYNDSNLSNISGNLNAYYNQTIADNIAASGVRGPGAAERINNRKGTPKTQRVIRATSRRLEGRAKTANADKLLQRDREVWNSSTESYEAPKATSRADINREEKAAASSPIAKGIDKVTEFFSNLFYGDKSKFKEAYKEKGVFGVLGEVSDSLKNFGETAKKWFSNLWTRFKESDWGSKFIKTTKDKVVGAVKGQATYAKDLFNKGLAHVKGVSFGADEASTTTTTTEAPTNARGGLVRKSGMAAVSEGEIILPADYNPYYSGGMSRDSRTAVEKASYRRWLDAGGSKNKFFGYYAEGGEVSPNKKFANLDPERDLTDGDIESIRTLYNRQHLTPQQIAERNNLPVDRVEYVIDKIARKHKRKDIINDYKNRFNTTLGKFKNSDIGKGLSSLGNAAKDQVEKVLGNSKLYQDTKELGKEAAEVVKKDKGINAVSSGFLGALAGGALTGSGLGLLGGFVIGAGANIIKNSDKVSEKLFGKKDKDGNYDTSDSIIKNPKVSKFLRETLPESGKAGGLGTIVGGLVTGSPAGMLTGLVVGSGLKMLSTSDKFQDAILGRKGPDGKRKGGLVGSLNYHVINPLKNYVQTGLKNLSGFIHKNILDPFKNLGKNTWDWVKGKATSTAKNLLEKGRDKVKRTFSESTNPLIRRASKIVGGVGKFGVNVAKGIISVPGKAANAVSNKIAKHNIRMGYSNKSAEDRLALIGKDKADAYDIFAADKNNAKDIKEIARYLNGSSGIQKEIYNLKQTCSDKLVDLLPEEIILDHPGIVKRFRSYFNTKEALPKKGSKEKPDTNFYQLREYIRNLGENIMPSTLKTEAYDLLDKLKIDLDSAYAAATADNKQKASYFNELKERTGLDLTNISNNEKLRRKIRNQSAIDAGFTDEKANDDAKARIEEAKKLAAQNKENPQGKETNEHLSAIQQFLIKRFANHENNVVNKREEKQAEYTTDSAGRPIKQTTNSQGEKIPDMQDSETRAAIEKSEAVEDAQIKTGETLDEVKKSGLFASLLSFFKPKKDEEEKKESIFDKLKDKLFGENGLLGGLSGKLSGLLGGKSIGSIISSVAPTLLTTAAVAGGSYLLGKRKAGTGQDYAMRKGMSAEDRQAEIQNKGFLGRTGEYIKTGFRSVENMIRGRDTTTYNEDNYVSEYYDERAKKGVAKNLLMGFNPKLASASQKVIGATLGKVPIIKHITAKPMEWASKLGTSKVGEKLLNGASKLGSKLAGVGKGIGSKISGLGTKLAETKVGKFVLEKGSSFAKSSGLADVATKVADKIKKILKLAAEKLGISTNAVDDAATQIGAACAEKGGKKLADILSKAAAIFYIAQIALAVEDGFEDAKCMSILGILDTPNIGQRFLAGALNGLNYAIPGIGGIIPTETLVNIFYTVLSKLGVDFGKWGEQRTAAKSTLEEYNKENGTTYNLEEYIANVLGKQTTQQKIKTGAKKLWTGVKEGATNLWGKIFGNGKVKSPDDEAGASNVKAAPNYDTEKNSASGTNQNQKFTIFGAYPGNNTASDWNANAGGRSGIHTSQKGNFRRFGTSTIDQEGCGPVSAATVLKAYGKNANVNDLANYAINGGYAGASKGTKASYFGDILGQNGISTNYIENKAGIRNAVESGRPTVLLGQDASNKSKSNSPFGPNPHYVVARGIKNGRVIVDDPEQGTTTSYNKSILNKSKLGIATGGDSGLSSIFSGIFGSILGTAANSLGGTAGSLLSMILGDSAVSADAVSENGTAINGTTGKVSLWQRLKSLFTPSSANTSGIAYDNSSPVRTGNSPFPILTGLPSAGDPYIKLYNNANNGGISTAINGNNAKGIRVSYANTLPNCVGWAQARFNHIYNYLTGNTGNNFSYFNCNARDFVSRAEAHGLTVSSVPQAGAIICWYSPDCGHVGIVEEVLAADKIKTSESGWSASSPFMASELTSANGWKCKWMGNGYKFLGFIYNPAVEQYYAKGNSGTVSTAINKANNTGITYMASGSGLVGSVNNILHPRKYSGGSSGIPKQVAAAVSRAKKTVNFTGGASSRRVNTSYRGGATGIPIATTATPVVRSYMPTQQTGGYSVDSETLKQILVYLKQVASNTGYNASIPAIIDSLKGMTGMIGTLNTRSDTGLADENAVNNMNREVSLMMSKLEAIATTL